MVLVGGGWDSTIVDNYFGIGAAALQRGYHVLMSDGPGQGTLLIDEGITLRHDWEKVVTPLVDAVLKIDVVDPKGIVLEPWSLGGYMAPRAGAFEHRLAAVICDPGQIDVGGKFSEALATFHLEPRSRREAARPRPGGRAGHHERAQKNPPLYWKVVKRGFWTNGASDLTSFLVELGKWKLDPALVGEIRCSTLVTAAESDMASSNAKELYDALTCPKAMPGSPTPTAPACIAKRSTARWPTGRSSTGSTRPWPAGGEPGDHRSGNARLGRLRSAQLRPTSGELATGWLRSQ